MFRTTIHKSNTIHTRTFMTPRASYDARRARFCLTSRIQQTIAAAVCAVLLGFSVDSSHAAVDVPVLLLQIKVPTPPALSNREPLPDDLTIAGAKLGIEDSNTTGRFLGHKYHLTVESVNDADAAVAAAQQWLVEGNSLILADLPTSALHQLAESLPLGESALVINTTDPSDDWRSSECRSGLLHSTPSRAMLADGLAQFLASRRWREWFLLHGARPEDLAFTEALNRAAKRFGAKIVAQKAWSFDTDLRRTAQSELPLFTQARDYDVVLVADVIGDVGEFVPYNTWLPRPVAGTQGMVATAWSPVIEQWGALQLQNRFARLADRGMLWQDFGAWLAVRMVAEAVTRTQSAELGTLYNYMLSDDFEVAAFLGRTVTLRRWNGQARQPITLVQPRAVVSQSPQQGFLHPRTELDTLGYDQAEVNCNF